MSDTIKLSDLPRALSALGVSISYQALWRRTVQGIFNAHRVNGRWYVHTSDIPAIAATRSRNTDGRSTGKILVLNGREMTQAQWARELGINPITLYARFSRGWSTERALTAPVRGA